MPAKFPAAILTQADVGGPMSGIPFNEWTANGATTAGQAVPFSLVVNEVIDATVPASGNLTTANGEVLHYSAYNAATKTFTVDLRAQQGTTAAAIDTGTPVGQWFTRDQWNQIVADLIAVETQQSQGADIASAATITPGTDGQYAHITGTATITAIATLPKGRIFIAEFTGAAQITHNGTSLILQGSVNYTTAAGDIIAFISEGAGNWRELFRRTAAATSGGINWKEQLYQRVAANETTTSTSAADLTTVMTLTTGVATLNDNLMVRTKADAYNNAIGDGWQISTKLDAAVAVLGATYDPGSVGAANIITGGSVVRQETGLSAATHTEKVQYNATTGGAAGFRNRDFEVTRYA